MTSVQDSELLTRVGPGTPMGNLMRHYWLPALKSSELIADGDPEMVKADVCSCPLNPESDRQQSKRDPLLWAKGRH